MNISNTKPALAAALAMAVAPIAGTVSAQELPAGSYEAQAGDITVTGTMPSDLSQMPEGPTIEGVISARQDDRIQVTTETGERTVVGISPTTEIRSIDEPLYVCDNVNGLNPARITGNQLVGIIFAKI